jgi:transmembrane protein 231
MIFGDVITMQTSPLFCHKRKINNFYNYSIISNGNDINSYKLDTIIKEYSRRNISTTLTNVYTSFALGKTRKFNMDLKIRYPEDNIYYRPGFWQIMKWAWVQYLAIYIIISWFVNKIKSYIFSRRLVLFYEENPLKKKQ